MAECCQAIVTISGNFAPNVLTTDGDLLTISDNYTRLPIGSEGDVLTVSGGLPTWGSTSSITTDTFANRPAAPAAGTFFLPSDGFFASRYNGTSWANFGPLFPLTAPPAVSSLTWVNQSSTTTDETKGGIFFDKPGTPPHDIALLLLDQPTPPFTATACILPMFMGINACGLAFYETGTGEIHSFFLGLSGVNISSSLWNSTSSFNTHYLQMGIESFGYSPIWLRIADTGTDRVCSLSADGQNFMEFNSVSNTNFLTADKIGFALYTRETIYNCGMTVLSWKVE